MIAIDFRSHPVLYTINLQSKWIKREGCCQTLKKVSCSPFFISVNVFEKRYGKKNLFSNGFSSRTSVLPALFLFFPPRKISFLLFHQEEPAAVCRNGTAERSIGSIFPAIFQIRHMQESLFMLLFGEEKSPMLI